MNKTKKFTTIISMLVLCTLMLGMLTGCGSSKADPLPMSLFPIG